MRCALDAWPSRVLHFFAHIPSNLNIVTRVIHPNVLRAVGYHPAEYQGFAWGMGVERPSQLKLGVDDMRVFYENDMRFLNQFRATSEATS
jgi:hypothetical protein